MNKVQLTGRITKDPELRYSSNGLANLMFTIAVDRQVRDASGQRLADFISCVAWGQQADFISRYVKKGNMLGIVGRIQTRQYQGNDGQQHYVTEVVVEAVESLTPRDANAVQTQGNVQQNNFQQPTYGGAQPQYQQPQYNQPKDPYQGFNNPTYVTPQTQEDDSPKSFNVGVDDEDLPF